MARMLWDLEGSGEILVLQQQSQGESYLWIIQAYVDERLNKLKFNVVIVDS